MKGERRHELEQNVLADWLAKNVDAIKPYANLILAVVVLAVVGTFGYLWWVQKSAKATNKAWDAFYSAMASQNPADLDQVAEQYPGTNVAHWATVITGDVHLAAGCDQLFTNRASANQELAKAVDAYKTVLNQTSVSELRERATFGLARAFESQGDLAEAKERYKELIRNWPKGAYTVMAKQRAEALTEPATKTFYDKFAKFDPKPAFSEEPGTPGERPSFDLDSIPNDSSTLTPSDLMQLDVEEKPDAKPDAANPDDAATPPKTTGDATKKGD